MNIPLSAVTKLSKKDELFKAFQADHAKLGKGLYALRTALLGDKPKSARKFANTLLRDSGAHIAFEEHDFYPALRDWLSDEEVGQMYREHAEGRQTLESISRASDLELEDGSNFNEFIFGIEDLERHVAGCGDLFGALGGLTEEDATRLLERLQGWRELAPSWAESGSAELKP